MAGSVNISGRLSQEDYEFLMGLDLPGQPTASDKVRHAVAFLRQYHEGLADAGRATEALEEMLEPGRRALLGAEREARLAAEVPHLLLDRLPGLLAVLVAARRAPGEEAAAFLRRVEHEALPALGGLLSQALRLGVGRRPRALNPSAYRELTDDLRAVLELPQPPKEG